MKTRVVITVFLSLCLTGLTQGVTTTEQKIRAALASEAVYADDVGTSLTSPRYHALQGFSHSV